MTGRRHRPLCPVTASGHIPTRVVGLPEQCRVALHKSREPRIQIQHLGANLTVVQMQRWRALSAVAAGVSQKRCMRG
ncbi:hypothetical protein HH1059_03920 [Halorhodospira halochloris]|uniref:Uncharacterized protein n=1 Tax=Halorhodospira halochloris TaxID=1052 RepID=A0A2Z6EZA5_HALHR|nr:hypothetical protein HH1059_03920 [Halorhodospira halochloris]